ncbi:MAG: CT583 family protein [Verrucomicrobiota bacterium]|nr:CT583 family protein [Verrucomicrobiota bacterium]
MSKFNDLLNLRFKIRETKQPKMTALVERSNNGDLSSFSGVFRISDLNEKEKADLEHILKSFRANESDDVDADLKALSMITAEVKAITSQAIMLHGERIKRAQELLRRYRDGAFTAWLFATYRNRQTPYNFLQYYEFYTTMPQTLHPKMDQMPRQAIYSLASRQGSMEKKEEIIRNYCGQAKQELLKLIRQELPLDEDDKRHPNFASHAISFLKRAREMVKNPLCVPSEEEKRQIHTLLTQLNVLLEKR